MALMSNRDFAYILVPLALIGRVHWFLIRAALGIYLFAVTLWLMSFYERREVFRNRSGTTPAPLQVNNTA